ncbi:head-tail connector protein [Hansschlegelia beijingensis]|uniref:Putative phiE125 gp8 family phage protein n=1 Tax=Hansschlegelia beijingensis TaxID=1133344 RepID=A0A7W6D177_9HYPH|nr:head-tail connector protein [Hansschlegelia beijingensis]MBB3972776.1 putative phiE125 gp8 family phage protein [Hansschlegelia beijingensis]
MNEWGRLKLVTAPAADPVTLAEAKKHLRVMHDDEDALISMLIKAAAAQIEGPSGIGVALVTQTWRLSLDGFPCEIEIPLTPVSAVDSVTFKDAAGADVAFTDFAVDLDASPTLVAPAYGATWPVPRCERGSVKVEFTAGYGAPSDVPADLRAAVLLIVGHLYENREAVVLSNQQPFEMPMAVDSILNRYRVGRFG